MLQLFLLVSGVAAGEVKNIGTPYIRNFSKDDYRGGTQNWGAAQDSRGFMYFANNDGLLVFDGEQWQLYTIPNRSMVRSVYIDESGDIYIGAYNDLGKMVWSENGKMTFRSLKELIPEENRNFDDVWHICQYRDKIVFQTYDAAYFFREGSPVAVLKAPSRFQNSFNVRGRLIFNDAENGLMEYDGTMLSRIEGCAILAGEEIISLMPKGDDNDILVCTPDRGLFIYDGRELVRWNVPASRMLIRDQIFSAVRLDDNYFAVGTILNGLMIVDSEGNIIQQINKKNGLQNNTILNVFYDRDGNLWLLLNKGIDYLTINSPVTFIQNAEGFGAGYAAVIHGGKIYLGTNQGLYVKSWLKVGTEEDYRMIEGTDGQVWHLSVHRGVLLCGHNKGTFIVDGDRARLISDIPGGWKYHELNSHPEYLVGGTFSGIILFRWQEGIWKFDGRVEGFGESFRVFEEDKAGDLWMSHGFKGIYRIRLGSRLDTVSYYRFYNSDDGLPTDYNLVITRLRDRIVVLSEAGVFEYLPEEDRFTSSQYINRLLSPVVGISYLMEDRDGNIWYVSENRAGVLRLQEDSTYNHLTTPFLPLSGRFIPGFESVYSYSSDHLFFGTEDGFAHYSAGHSASGPRGFSAYIVRSEALHQDTVFYFGGGSGPDQVQERPYSFKFHNNVIRFTFTSPLYNNAGNTEYSCMLEGFDDRWSAWERTYTKEYSNLPDGRYTFRVKARDMLGRESLPDQVEFVIEHPWYKSPAAYLAYMIALLSLVLFLVRFVNWRIELSKRRERINSQRIYQAKEQEYIRQALEAEKEIIRIRNEKLKAEMIQRDKELANEAMNLVRKNEFLLSLKKELSILKSVYKDNATGSRIRDLYSRINREVDNNNQMEVFAKAFDEVHEDFINRLKSRYPTLTPTELRLCAFLKMNITTKEIAPLMNISVRGVEICRYRVRKKMGIPRETNLTTHILNL
ncbi:MAG: triple tyrosine motif-containing protein [Bacteroidales bacterium]|nr:triple tyrosine motif-containing protein [Bacteroidales bacterium]